MNKTALGVGLGTLLAGGVAAVPMVQSTNQFIKIVEALSALISELGMPGTVLALIAVIVYYETKKIPAIEQRERAEVSRLITHVESIRAEEKQYREDTLKEFKDLLRDMSSLMAKNNIVMDTISDYLMKRRLRRESSHVSGVE